MNRLRLLLAWISRWIDDAALGLLRVGGFLRPGRRIQLVEQADGGFAPTQTDKRGCTTSLGSPLHVEDNELVSSGLTKSQSLLAGSQVEVVLAPSRFLFRELELPLRASEFLEGVVREQIDRLTPWRSSDAAFGWSAPAKLDDKRILVTVAATTRASIASLEQAVAPNEIELACHVDTNGGRGRQNLRILATQRIATSIASLAPDADRRARAGWRHHGHHSGRGGLCRRQS